MKPKKRPEFLIASVCVSESGVGGRTTEEEGSVRPTQDASAHVEGVVPLPVARPPLQFPARAEVSRPDGQLDLAVPWNAAVATVGSPHTR
jgi:hypothetical protein